MSSEKIGTLTVGENVVHHNQSFETAAWWQDEKLEPGTYPVATSDNGYWVLVKVPSVIVDEYFPTLYGGVVIGHSHEDKRRVGRETHSHIQTQPYAVANSILNGREPFANWGTFKLTPGYEARVINFEYTDSKGVTTQHTTTGIFRPDGSQVGR